MTTEKKTTYRYMEYLRVLCAFAVILVHVSGQNWFNISLLVTKVLKKVPGVRRIVS